MSECSTLTASEVPCPGDVDLWARTLCALLPPGFAFYAADEAGTLMNGRVRAVAHLFDAYHQEICALRPEFRCDTADRTLDDWHIDYEIPDPCGVNDLCAKVFGMGDGTCESLVDLGRTIGMEIECSSLDVEIQPNGWNLGFGEMPPDVVWLDGGSELGEVCLGYCPPIAAGSGLGLAEDDCIVTGFHELDPLVPLVPGPCEPDGCVKWERPARGTLDLCHAVYRQEYVGNAHHLRIGLHPSSELLSHTFPQMGDMNIGCDQLCAPPVAEVVCWIERHMHAHVVPIPHFVDTTPGGSLGVLMDDDALTGLLDDDVLTFLSDDVGGPFNPVPVPGPPGPGGSLDILVDEDVSVGLLDEDGTTFLTD